MEKELKKKQLNCSSCGGRLEYKNSYLYECTQCGQKYYISVDRTHRVRIRLSIRKIIIIIAAVLMAITTVGVIGYQYYTSNLVSKASRFSVVVRDFLMEAYGKPIAQVSEDDLDKIRYLKIERDEVYRFYYSFEDYYDYNEEESYEETLKIVEVEGRREDFSPANLEYFSGLTRVELYTEGWENYVLPKENQLRYILCKDSLSRYGTPKFFQRLNPDTIEEVVILDAEGLSDFSFLSDLNTVKKFTLKDATLKSVDAFENMSSLENLSLDNVVMEEEKVYGMVTQLLSLPSLKNLSISGSYIWHIAEEQWADLQETYQGKITLRRE